MATILCVDDEPDVRIVYPVALGGNGLQVIVAGDGREGLQIYRENHPRIAVVLSDYNMPQMNGLDLLRALRREYGIGMVPFVLASAESQKRTIELCTEAREQGAAGLLKKPFSLTLVEMVIQELIENNGRSPSLDQYHGEQGLIL